MARQLRQLAATSHECRFSYWIDYDDRYVYQFDEINRSWVGWLCALSVWEDGYFRKGYVDDVPQDFNSAAREPGQVLAEGCAVTEERILRAEGTICLCGAGSLNGVCSVEGCVCSVKEGK